MGVGRGIEELTREDELGTINRLSRGAAIRVVGGCTEVNEHPREVCRPVRTGQTGSESIFKAVM
jgi:hypothetical protein